MEPYINPELSPNVTGVLGKEVRLACHVEDLGNKTVSNSSLLRWMCPIHTHTVFDCVGEGGG